MDTADALRRAKDLIIRDGWVQESFGTDSPDPKCPLGALWSLHLPPVDELRAKRMLVDAIGLPAFDEVTDWNDDPARTITEVLAAFDAAIALAESEAA